MIKLSLDDSPQYTALSYVWGSEMVPTTIYVNGVAVSGNKNLAIALKSIRTKWSQICLWVDATSINQVDLTGKASQIPMMGQIYQNAERVICWSSHNPETAIDIEKCLLLMDANKASDEIKA
jgi:hypothetical protein